MIAVVGLSYTAWIMLVCSLYSSSFWNIFHNGILYSIEGFGGILKNDHLTCVFKAIYKIYYKFCPMSIKNTPASPVHQLHFGRWTFFDVTVFG